MPLQFSIRTKIVAGAASLLFAMFVIGAFSIVQLRSISAAAQAIQSKHLPSVRWLGEIRTQSAIYRGILRDRLLATDAKERSDVDKNLSDRADRYDAAVATYERLISTSEERGLFERLAQLWQAYRSSVGNVIELSQKGKRNKLRTQIRPVQFRSGGRWTHCSQSLSA